MIALSVACVVVGAALIVGSSNEANSQERLLSVGLSAVFFGLALWAGVEAFE